jgi:RNA polymerase sigma factor (sigma-70 family)
LSSSEERSLLRQAKQAEGPLPGISSARQKVIDTYIGLVIHIVNQHHCPGLERGDLIQEGLLGLMRAVDGFDEARGCRFATYAIHWIRQQIQRSIDQTGWLIGIPVDLVHASRKVQAAHDDFLRRHGYPPDLQELAAETGVPLRRLAGLRSCLEPPLSLDALHQSMGDRGAEHVDAAAPDPERELLRSAERSRVRDWLGALPRLDRQVIEYRYGLKGGEVGEEQFLERHGLDRAGLRRIERRALRRLRSYFRGSE